MLVGLKKSVRLGAVVATLAALALASPAAATAEPAVTPVKAPRSVTVNMQMRVVGFDRAVAAAHGFVIRKDAKGHEYAVRKGSAQMAPAEGNPVVTGNCGTSYIHFNAVGYQKATIDTGFGVVMSAVKYGWHVTVIDGIGAGTINWGGGLLFRTTWEGTTVTHSGTTGYATATVLPSSYATLYNGAVCTSMSPWDYTYYY